jgi:hypothetical protein
MRHKTLAVAVRRYNRDRSIEEMAMTRRGTFVLAVTLALSAGCATHWDVDSFEAPEGNVAARSTFHWQGGEFGTPASIDPQVIASTSDQLRRTVGRELARKGYTEVDSAAAADMLVSFQVAGTQRFVIADERRIGAPSATTVLRPGEIQPPPASMLPREHRVRDGSVLIFIDDRATGRLLWRGSVTAETRSGSTEQGIRIIDQMAREIALAVPARVGAPK